MPLFIFTNNHSGFFFKHNNHLKHRIIIGNGGVANAVYKLPSNLMYLIGSDFLWLSKVKLVHIQGEKINK